MDDDPSEQLIAATPSKENPMSVIMKRLDEIEHQLNSLNSSKKKWERSQGSTHRPNQPTQSHVQARAPVICYKCGQEGHFAHGCAARAKVSNINQGHRQVDQSWNVVSQPVNNNGNYSTADTIPAVSTGITADHTLQGNIRGIPARFLVDTGAAASILSKHVWNKVAKLEESLDMVTGKTLMGVEGSPLNIIGAVHLHVIFEKQQFTVFFLVADSLTAEAILERDFLRHNNYVIDVGKNLITFGNVGVTLKLSCLAGDSQIASVSVTLHDTLQVPASSEVEVIANVPEAASGGTWIVEGSTLGKQALFVARTLVTPVGKSVPLRLLNPRSELVKVTRGSVVAQMESVESFECSVIGMTQLSSPVSEVPKVNTQAIDGILNQLGSHVSSVQ